MSTFLLNYKIRGVITVNAKNKKGAKEAVNEMNKQEFIKYILNELEAGNLEIGTIEKL